MKFKDKLIFTSSSHLSMSLITDIFRLEVPGDCTSLSPSQNLIDLNFVLKLDICSQYRIIIIIRQRRDREQPKTELTIVLIILL